MMGSILETCLGGACLRHLLIRGTKMKDINIQNELRPLIEKARKQWVEKDYRHEWSDATILGLIVSHYTQWDGDAIKEVSFNALHDANFHREADALEQMFETCDKERRQAWEVEDNA